MSETAENTIPANEAVDRGNVPADQDDQAAPANGETEGEGQSDAEKQEPPKREDWRDVRMRQYVARARAEERARNDAERRAEALAAELNAVRRMTGQTGQDNAQPNGQQQPGQPRPPAEVEREAEARVAARLAAQAEAERFNESCNKTAEAGTKAYQDFDRSITGWNREGLDMVGNAEHRDLIGFINGLPNAHDVFYSIGTTPNEVAHLLSLNPRQQAIEINRIAATARAKPAAATAAAAPAAARPASNAPPPPRQSAAAPRSSSSDLADPHMSIEKWMAERNKAARR